MERSPDREWIERVLRHTPGERVPYNVSLTPPARRAVEAWYGAPVEARLALPIRMTGLNSLKPLYADPRDFGSTARDEFGVVWSTNSQDRGAPVGPCLPDPSLAAYTFPDPRASYRFESLEAWCRAHERRYRIVWVGDLWERATFMRGMEALALDVAVNPRFVDALLQSLADYVRETMEVLFQRFDFEGVALSDDYATQKGMIISPGHWRALVKPHLRDLYGFAKQQGRTVFHHSCGNVTEIVPDLVDLGLDILHPVQPEAMDLTFLKREFGRELTLCGGVPTQTLLVHGTPVEVRREVRRLKEDLGRDGGYILEPGISVQADVPLPNLIALLEEAQV